MSKRRAVNIYLGEELYARLTEVRERTSHADNRMFSICMTRAVEFWITEMEKKSNAET